MNNKASITALMSLFGRAFHAENEKYPVFVDYLAKELMIGEEYATIQGYHSLFVKRSSYRSIRYSRSITL